MEFKIEPHHFIHWRTFPYPVCVKCGLVRLRNDFTQWAEKHGCDYKEHPRLAAARHKFTKHNGPPALP